MFDKVLNTLLEDESVHVFYSERTLIVNKNINSIIPLERRWY